MASDRSPARVVVADASPLRYLIVIEAAGLLPVLYSEILIPATVARELANKGAPEVVRAWVDPWPDWVRIIPDDDLRHAEVQTLLDAGERAALTLAVAQSADLVLMDDRAGVREAKRLGFAVTGTLGILDKADELSLLPMSESSRRLRLTNFRASTRLLDALLEASAQRNTRR